MFILLLVSTFLTIDAALESITTTKTYEIEVPGSESIRIVEGEPLWNVVNTTPTTIAFEHRTLGFTTDKTKTNIHNPNNNGVRIKKFAPQGLHDFLNSYSEKLRKTKPPPPSETVEEDDYKEYTTDEENQKNSHESHELGKGEKSKSWDLISVQKHNQPLGEKKGWVSMEAVPWSVSKIAKWQNNKPIQKPWQSDQIQMDNDYNSDEGQFEVKPSWGNKPSYETSNHNQYYNMHENNYDRYEEENTVPLNRPKPTLNKHQRPEAVFAQKLHIKPEVSGSKPHYINKRPQYNAPHRHHPENCDHDSDRIITDGLPPNFPTSYQQSTNRRRGTEFFPESHPFSGNGDWVLLSTTKGYKYPQQRQRSLQIEPDSIGAHKTVKLTVLPPLKNSKVNMTTSHGGLLQVESTFETVDQAQNTYARIQKLKQQKLKQKITKPKRNRHKTKRNKGTKLQGVKQQNTQSFANGIPSAVATTTRRHTTPNSSAVLAAVGAGMIPATMAMLVPVALNGRKKRAVYYATSIPLEITLPRSL